MPNEIQDVGIGGHLIRRLNIVDSPSPSPSLAPEVFPVVQVAPPSPEDEFLRGVYLSAAGGFQGGFAGQYSHFKLLNVAGAGIIVVLHQIQLTATTAVAVSWGMTAGSFSLGTFHPSGCRDSRIRPTTVSRQTHAVLSSENSISVPFAVSGKKLGTLIAPPNDIQVLVNVDCVLVPGVSFDIGTNTSNTYLSFTAYWSERRAQPSELG